MSSSFCSLSLVALLIASAATSIPFIVMVLIELFSAFSKRNWADFVVAFAFLVAFLCCFAAIDVSLIAAIMAFR